MWFRFPNLWLHFFFYSRCFSDTVLEKKNKHYIPSITFVIRCLVGLVLDSIDYGIIVFTADNIDVIFIVYSVFIVLIFVCILWKKEGFIFILTLCFKYITLLTAISIFTTTSNFEWETIKTSVTTVGSVGGRLFYGLAHICFFCGYLFQHWDSDF